MDVSVRIETPDEKHVTLSVRDHGVGIPPEELKSVSSSGSIASPIGRWRTSKGRASDCSSFAPLLRSTAAGRLRRARAKGTAPRWLSNCRETFLRRRTTVRSGEIGMSRVLIVEDEAHLAQGLRFNLEAEGHSVEVAGDGERAIELLLGQGKRTNGNGKRGTGKRERSQREEFDAVVLDVMLPGKDGFAVAAELRAAKNFVPVLMLTARGRPEDVLKGFASGADDYLPKPFELPILLARLQGLLRRREWTWASVPEATFLNAAALHGR